MKVNNYYNRLVKYFTNTWNLFFFTFNIDKVDLIYKKKVNISTNIIKNIFIKKLDVILSSIKL